MTRPVPPPTPELPESNVGALHALYREGATAEPSLSLDRCILDAARAELRSNGVSKRPTPWWKGWLPATSAIAAVVIGLSVTWRVMDEQERHLREEMRATQAEGERMGKAAPTQRPAEAQPLLSAPVPAPEKSRLAESAVVKDVPIGVPEPEAKSVPAAPAAPATMAPVIAEEAAKKRQRAENDEPREQRDASAAMESAASPARALGKLEAKSLGASGATAADRIAQPAADAATPEAWLKQIRELRAAGRSAEAAQSLARFRARYPHFVLPDDLRNLK